MAQHNRHFFPHINIEPIPKAGYNLIAVWILSMVSVPIIRWVWGDIAILYGLIITTIAQCSAVLYFLVQSWGIKSVLWRFLIAIVSTWLAEAFGSKVGFPFGEYDYTSLLQPQIANVPVLIPIAWFMMLPPAWAIARGILGKYKGPFPFTLFVLISAAALTAWDFFLDPQMVRWGLWTWENPIGYFGIPWVNFLGWMLTAIIVTTLIRPPAFQLGPHIAIYGIVWSLQIIGQLFFWELPGPAIVGALVMGIFLLAGYRGYKKHLS